ncbi:MAG: AAA domain-containing protein [Rhodothermales bacterium]|nr:AAA domain-containing protein [Rhodothermales bacterium]
MNLVEIERRLSSIEAGDNHQHDEHKKADSIVPPPPPQLTGIVRRIKAALHRKRQVILYGPPGTGKTYWAEKAIDELAARSWFDCSYDQLTDEQRQQLHDQGAIEHCCFHPAYGYEDFLIGYRPVLTDGAVGFEAKKGIFAKLCERAINDPKRDYFLLVDEINRGDIPRIFGELITVLEKDKRGKSMTLPLTGDPLVVPDNVQLVGTMNTADRSIALLDAALRRRFAFIELMPDSTTLRGASVGGLPLGPWLDELNHRVVQHAGRGSRNLQIGHSYLLSEEKGIQDKGRFADVLRDDIIPLLQEYCYEDFNALEKILGDAIVSSKRQTIQQTLFRPELRGELIEALLSAFPDVTATPEAVDADAEGETSEDEELDEGLEEEPGDEQDEKEPAA